MAQMKVKDAIKLALEEALDRDPNVVVIGEDIGKYGGAYSVTDGFLKKYGPKRIKDTPISEAAFIGAGIGAAAAGMRPVVELMSISFSLVAFDQIINMAANLRYMSGGQIKVPMVLRAPTGAGSQLAATHSQSFETWMAQTPGLKCVCPANPRDALGLLRAAIKDDNPVVFAEPALLYFKGGEVEDDYYEIEIGRAHIEREGSDVTMVSYGSGVGLLLDAADRLAERGVDAEVVNLRSLNPLDLETIEQSATKTSRLVVAEMARKSGGMMAEVATEIQERIGDQLDGPIVRVGSQNTPWPYNGALERSSLPQVDDVVNAVSRGFGL